MTIYRKVNKNGEINGFVHDKDYYKSLSNLNEYKVGDKYVLINNEYCSAIEVKNKNERKEKNMNININVNNNVNNGDNNSMNKNDNLNVALFVDRNTLIQNLEKENRENNISLIEKSNRIVDSINNDYLMEEKIQKAILSGDDRYNDYLKNINDLDVPFEGDFTLNSDGINDNVNSLNKNDIEMMLRKEQSLEKVCLDSINHVMAYIVPCIFIFGMFVVLGFGESPQTPFDSRITTALLQCFVPCIGICLFVHNFPKIKYNIWYFFNKFKKINKIKK